MTCEQCGAPFEVRPRHANQRFCSMPCRARAWYERNGETHRARAKVYRAAHPVNRLAYYYAWKQAHRGQYRRTQQRVNRARLAAKVGDDPIRLALFDLRSFKKTHRTPVAW